MKKKIGVMGLWHLGCTITAGLTAQNNLVIGFDRESERIEKLSHGVAPIFEPRLNERLQLAISERKLHFTNNLYDLNQVDLIWIAVDTKLDETDNCDLTEIIEYILMLKKAGICKDIVISSQIPCGTCKKIINILDNSKINVAYVPENFQLGKSLEYFESNNTWVIGTDNDMYAEKIKNIISKWCRNPIICNLQTAEMAKHAINTFLATTISFSNALSEVCIQMHADAYKVTEIMRQDERIGDKLPLLPGPWFSGGTLARDVQILIDICKKQTASESFFKAIINVNNTRIQYLLNRIKSYTSLKNKTVCILGIVYKKNTNTLRRSPGVQMYQHLKACGINSIIYYDTLVSRKDKSLLEDKGMIGYEKLDQAIQDANVLIILRNDIAEEIKRNNFTSLISKKIILDIPNSLNEENLKQYNTVVTPGRV